MKDYFGRVKALAKQRSPSRPRVTEQGEIQIVLVLNSCGEVETKALATAGLRIDHVATTFKLVQGYVRFDKIETIVWAKSWIGIINKTKTAKICKAW